MSDRSEEIKEIKKRILEIKSEFEKELENVIKQVGEGEKADISHMLRSNDSDEIVEGNIEDYEKRLEALKEDIKRLKKIKRNQKKISKLEEKKIDVLRDIERKKGRENKTKKHKRH